jgi:hypothetical protein
MSKKSDTVRYTAKQIKGKIARGEDRTDWRKADAVTGKKLEASILADVDDVHREPDWTRATIGIQAPPTMIESKPAAGKYHDSLLLAL